MTLQELQELVRAGFTKAEIMALNGQTSLVEDKPVTETESIEKSTVEVEKVPDDDKAEVTEEKEDKVVSPQTTTNVNFAPMMTDAQVEKLAHILNLGNATIDVPNKPNIDESLADHFKALMLGE